MVMQRIKSKLRDIVITMITMSETPSDDVNVYMTVAKTICPDWTPPSFGNDFYGVSQFYSSVVTCVGEHILAKKEIGADSHISTLIKACMELTRSPCVTLKHLNICAGIASKHDETRPLTSLLMGGHMDDKSYFYNDLTVSRDSNHLAAYEPTRPIIDSLVDAMDDKMRIFGYEVGYSLSRTVLMIHPYTFRRLVSHIDPTMIDKPAYPNSGIRYNSNALFYQIARRWNEFGDVKIREVENMIHLFRSGYPLKDALIIMTMYGDIGFEHMGTSSFCIIEQIISIARDLGVLEEIMNVDPSHITNYLSSNHNYQKKNIVKLLLENGSDPNSMIRGRTAMDLAEPVIKAIIERYTTIRTFEINDIEYTIVEDGVCETEGERYSFVRYRRMWYVGDRL